MKKLIITITLLITLTAVGQMSLTKPIQYNAVTPSSFYINIENRTVSVGIKPLLVVSNSIVSKGATTYIDLPSSDVIPLGCAKFSELGITSDNLADLITDIIKVGLSAQGMDTTATVTDWPVRELATEIVSSIELVDDEEVETITTNSFYVYKEI